MGLHGSHWKGCKRELAETQGVVARRGRKNKDQAGEGCQELQGGNSIALNLLGALVFGAPISPSLQCLLKSPQ